uniref:Putative secreted protein n=1 Tax=Panstrongylus lignarius TaxID=156445 RepID=A0A224XWH6_9HEMI
MLAATIISSCLQLLPAATALAVAKVIGFVHLTNISGLPLTALPCSIACSALISCEITSIVDSNALVPRVCSSSTAFTVFNKDVTFVTMTLADSLRMFIVGSLMDLPDAAFVACIKSPNAEATSFTALISIT